MYLCTWTEQMVNPIQWAAGSMKQQQSDQDNISYHKRLLQDIKTLFFMPQPSGLISVAYDTVDSDKAEIILPADVTGTFIWDDLRYGLHGGSNVIGL